MAEATETADSMNIRIDIKRPLLSRQPCKTFSKSVYKLSPGGLGRVPSSLEADSTLKPLAAQGHTPGGFHLTQNGILQVCRPYLSGRIESDLDSYI